MPSIRLRIVVLLFPLLLAAGCGGSKHPITGDVSYRGTPVAEGFITFFPTDNVGTSVGGPIAKGRYLIDDVLPGTYRVLVTSHPKVDVSGQVKLLPSIEILSTAANNNKEHQITAQQKTLDLAIDAKPGR